MTPHSLTCSGLALATQCSWSFRTDAEHAIEEPGKWAPNSAIHEAFAYTITTSDEAFVVSPALLATLTDGELAKTQRAHASFLADWYSDQRDGGWRAELAFAFDPETGAAMVLSPASHRDYSQVPTGWVPGTVDVIRHDREDLTSLDVIDWKSGHITPAVEDNAQLAGLGLAAGARHLRAAIGKVSEEGVELRWTTFDRFDLLDWRDRIAAIVRRIPDAEATPGPWCRDRMCRSYGLCPATVGSLELAAPEAKRMLPVVTAASAIESHEHAAELLRLMREAKAGFEARYNAVREALRIFADANGGIPVAGGKTWIKRETTRETIDLSTPAAVKVLGEQLGAEAFEAAVEHSTSKAAIKRAAKLVKEKTGEAIASVEKRTVAALREAGAVKVSTCTSYDEAKLLPEKASDAA